MKLTVTSLLVQDEQGPILTLEAGIAAGSFAEVPDGQGGSSQLGDANKALREAKHTIHKAEYALLH